MGTLDIFLIMLTCKVYMNMYLFIYITKCELELIKAKCNANWSYTFACHET